MHNIKPPPQKKPQSNKKKPMSATDWPIEKLKHFTMHNKNKIRIRP